MRLGPLFLVSSLAVTVLAASAPGCRDATQVTLDITLSRAQCAEIHGTAITIGVDPLDTEDRVKNHFVTATTADCDPATGRIGTLVVTPGDDDRASVVVAVSYGKDLKDPSNCTPPNYDGCIVARRKFAFAEHTSLRMPISLDPDCANTPCDAFSTCRTGVCYSSDVPTSSCEGGSCAEPGELPDGGASEAGVVVPDAGEIVDATIPDAPSDVVGVQMPDGSIVDSGTDGGGTPGQATCAGTILYCGTDACPTGQTCCSLQDGTQPTCMNQCASGMTERCCNGSCKTYSDASTGPVVACGLVSTNMSLPSEWHTLNANTPAGTCPVTP